jgi:hypothetical protein
MHIFAKILHIVRFLTREVRNVFSAEDKWPLVTNEAREGQPGAGGDADFDWEKKREKKPRG